MASGLLMLVVLGGVGFPIHQISCHCKDRLVVSLACSDTPCGNGACSEENGGKGCADCKVIYLKADLNLILSKEKKLALEEVPALPPARPWFSNIFTETSSIPPVSAYAHHRPSGKDLLPILQVYLC